MTSSELRTLLSELGFTKGKGFDGEIWTNRKSEWMAQVWICLSGKSTSLYFNYDARNDFKLVDFFQWWEKVSTIEHTHNEAVSLVGNDW